MNHSDFISNARTLADRTISIANDMGGVASTLKYSDVAETLSAEDFVGENEGLAPEQVLAFLNVLGKTIQNLSDDDKKAIYAIKH